jgi:hypothetical protein
MIATTPAGHGVHVGALAGKAQGIEPNPAPGERRLEHHCPALHRVERTERLVEERLGVHLADLLLDQRHRLAAAGEHVPCCPEQAANSLLERAVRPGLLRIASACHLGGERAPELPGLPPRSAVVRTAPSKTRI